jgi:hypothetical protein
MYTLLQRKKAERTITSAGSLFLLKTEAFLQPLLATLDAQLDKRLVRTFYDVFVSILRFRNRAFGLVLSELGAFVLSPKQAPAGTKRISNLLRSKNWTHEVIAHFLLQRAAQRLQTLRKAGQRVLLLWDDSVVEKPESWFSEGLCSVASSRAKRLTQIRTGFYRPPTRRICVPGYEWSAVLMTTLSAVPALVAMRWWTTRGKFITDRKSQFLQLYKTLRRHLTEAVVHVLDRGYASSSLLERFIADRQHFIVRWIKTYTLRDAHGKLHKPGDYAQTEPERAIKVIYDAPRRCYRRVALAYCPVFLPDHPDHVLTLVICSPKQVGGERMFLLTNCPVPNKAAAWAIFFAYLRRWHIEQTFRFTKSELALESPRLWFFENRLKLLAIVALAYDFLLQFWRNWQSLARVWINTWCPRTGKRQLDAQLPLYRLRIALVFLLNDFVAQNSG